MRASATAMGTTAAKKTIVHLNDPAAAAPDEANPSWWKNCPHSDPPGVHTDVPGWGPAIPLSLCWQKSSHQTIPLEVSDCDGQSHGQSHAFWGGS
jgi:hypothetical protein